MTVDKSTSVCCAWRPAFLFALAAVVSAVFAGRVFASQSVELNWSPSPSPNIVSYKVYFGTQSHSYPNCIVYGDLANTVVSGLEGGQTYYFAVSAVDADGRESDLSSEAVYQAPSSGIILPQAQATTVAMRAVDVTWTPNTDPDVYGYMVYYGTAHGVYTNSATFYFTTEGLITGLAGGTKYYFAVAPIDSLGVGTVSTNEASFTVPNPQAIALQAQTAVGSSGVHLSWNEVPNQGIGSYNIYYGTQSGQYTASVNYGAQTDVVVHGLNSGQTYYFAVTGLDGYGNETRVSNQAVAAAATVLPVQLQVQGTTAATRAVNAVWTPSTDLDVYGYVVYYGTQSGVYTNSAWFYYSTEGIISGLAGGTKYYFAVAPVDAYGIQPALSQQVSITVSNPPPLVLHAAVQTNTSGVALDWNDIPNQGVAYYLVYYGTESSNYTASVYLSGVTNTVLHGLTGGQTYYLAVASVDGYGNQSPFSGEKSVVAPFPKRAKLQTQTYADGNGQVYLIEVNTMSAVYGSWELDYTTDLQNWYPYAYGNGNGNGDGYDVDAYVSVDPSMPQMFFRLINY